MKFSLGSFIALIFGISIIYGFSSLAPEQSSEAGFKDTRDGQFYPTVEIAGLTWFARDLSFMTTESFWFDDNYKNGEIYGRLYRWEDACSACPPGWHLSTDYEWQALELALGVPFAGLAGRGNRGTDQGKRLKPGGDTGFNVTYGGWRRSEDGGYEALGKNAAYWTATESDLNHAWHRDIDVGDDQIFRSRVVKPYALSGPVCQE